MYTCRSWRSHYKLPCFGKAGSHIHLDLKKKKHENLLNNQIIFKCGFWLAGSAAHNQSDTILVIHENHEKLLKNQLMWFCFRYAALEGFTITLEY